MTWIRAYSRLMYSQIRLTMNRIPYVCYRSAYSTRRPVKGSGDGVFTPPGTPPPPQRHRTRPTAAHRQHCNHTAIGAHFGAGRDVTADRAGGGGVQKHPRGRQRHAHPMPDIGVVHEHIRQGAPEGCLVGFVLREDAVRIGRGDHLGRVHMRNGGTGPCTRTPPSRRETPPRTCQLHPNGP